MAQNVPAAGEIAGQEKHQQQPDDFHRLKAQQVYLGVARARPRPKENQEDGKSEAGQQRHKAQLAHQPLIVERTARGQQHRAHGYALREIDEQQVVAHRVAQAHHEDQPDARQQHDRRQKDLIAREAANAPPQVRQQQCREKQTCPQTKGALKFSRTPHHEQGLERAQLIARQQGDGGAIAHAFAEMRQRARIPRFIGRDADARDGADIGKPAGGIEYLARHEFALRWIRKHG